MSENNLYNNLHARVARWYTANSNSGEPCLVINSSHSITNYVLIDWSLKFTDKCCLWPGYTQFSWDFPRLPNGEHRHSSKCVFSFSLSAPFLLLPPSSPPPSLSVCMILFTPIIQSGLPLGVGMGVQRELGLGVLWGWGRWREPL